MDTWGGQSGSAVYAYFKIKQKRVIYGIHRGWDGLEASTQEETTYNVAKRITSKTFAQLCGWMSPLFVRIKFLNLLVQNIC